MMFQREKLPECQWIFQGNWYDERRELSWVDWLIQNTKLEFRFDYRQKPYL